MPETFSQINSWLEGEVVTFHLDIGNIIILDILLYQGNLPGRYETVGNLYAKYYNYKRNVESGVRRQKSEVWVYTLPALRSTLPAP